MALISEAPDTGGITINTHVTDMTCAAPFVNCANTVIDSSQAAPSSIGYMSTINLTNLLTSGTVTHATGIPATAGANHIFPTFTLRGSSWNGSASVNDDWYWSEVLGTGATPSATLNLRHSPTSVRLVQMFTPMAVENDPTGWGLLDNTQTTVTGGLRMNSDNSVELWNVSNSHPLLLSGSLVTANGKFALKSVASYSCTSSTPGQINYIAGGTGVKDIVQVCAKDGSDVWAWRTIY
jgi:hypothetical protein